MEMADGIIFAVVYVVLAILGEIGINAAINAGPNGTGPYFDVASNIGLIGVHAFDFLVQFAVAIFIFVVVFIAFSMVRYRVRKGERTTGDAPVQYRYNRAFVGTWIVLSILLNLLFWIHPTASGLEAVFAAELPQNNHNELVVDVTARQWEWIFSYPQYHIQQALNAQGQDVLYLPVDRPVKFVLRSYDPFHTFDDQDVQVIHSFWIPAFGDKVDVIPGETRYMFVTPTQLQDTENHPWLRVQCAEVCGGGHPYMEANVHVVTAAQFQQWVKSQQSSGS
jgi:cytochrome c oxidase subunit 2